MSILLLAAFLLAPSAEESAPTARDVETELGSLVDDLRQASAREGRAERDRAMKAVLREHVDWQGFAERSMRDLDRRLSLVQQTEVGQELGKLVEARILNRVDPQFARRCIRPKVEVFEAGPDAFEAGLDCPDVEAQLVLSFRRTKEGWSMVDVSADGALLSRQYRSMLNRYHRQHGLDALLARLRALREAEEGLNSKGRSGADSREPGLAGATDNPDLPAGVERQPLTSSSTTN